MKPHAKLHHFIAKYCKFDLLTTMLATLGTDEATLAALFRKSPKRRNKKTRWSDQRVRLRRRKLLLLLVSHHSELLLPFMGSNLMLLSFSSTRHCRTPYVPQFGTCCNYGGYYRDFQGKRSIPQKRDFHFYWFAN